MVTTSSYLAHTPLPQPSPNPVEATAAPPGGEGQESVQESPEPCAGEQYARCVKRSVSITAAQDERLMADVAAGRAASYSEALRAALADADRYRRAREESSRRELGLRRQVDHLNARLVRRPGVN